MSGGIETIKTVDKAFKNLGVDLNDVNGTMDAISSKTFTEISSNLRDALSEDMQHAIDEAFNSIDGNLASTGIKMSNVKEIFGDLSISSISDGLNEVAKLTEDPAAVIQGVGDALASIGFNFTDLEGTYANFSSTSLTNLTASLYEVLPPFAQQLCDDIFGPAINATINGYIEHANKTFGENAAGFLSAFLSVMQTLPLGDLIESLKPDTTPDY